MKKKALTVKMKFGSKRGRPPKQETPKSEEEEEEGDEEEEEEEQETEIKTGMSPFVVRMT